MSKRLVLGIGSILQGDEGVGVHVVRRLESLSLPPDVLCLDGGTGGLVLLEPMQEAREIVLVDAMVAEAPVGTIQVLHPRFAREYPKTLTAHEIGLKDLLDAFCLLGHTSTVTLYGIVIDPQQPIATELSPAVAKAAEQVAETIAQRLWSAQPVVSG
jgi:hydrogenase maturation protease